MTVAAVAFVLTGCGVREAMVDDLSNPSAIGRRARVIAVDGRPPARASSRYYTVIPFVLLDPGPHVLRVRVLRDDSLSSPADTLTVEARLSAGKTYWFEMRDGTLGLAEQSRNR